MLPMGDRFLLWALRQWRCEIACWDRGTALPESESLLRRGFEHARLASALPYFAMTMDVLWCGMSRPLEILPVPTPIVSPDEGTFLALRELAQEGLNAQLAACVTVLVPLERRAFAIAEMKRLAALLNDAGLGSASASGSDGSWIH